MVRLSEVMDAPETADIEKTPRPRMRLSDAMRMGAYEIPQVEAVDKGFGGNIVEGVLKGFASAPQVLGNVTMAFGDYVRSEKHSTIFGTKPILDVRPIAQRVFETGKRITESNERFIAEKFPEQKGLTFSDKFAQGVGQGAVSLASAIGLGVMAGPGAAAIAFGGVAGTEGFNEARLKDKDLDTSLSIAGTLGFVEGGLEFWGINRLIKIKGGSIRKIVAGAVNGMVTEFSQEFAQSSSSGVIKTGTGLREFKGLESVKRIIGEALFEGAIGAVLGGSAGISFSLFQREAVEEGLEKMGMEKQQAVEVADGMMRDTIEQTISEVETLPESTGEVVAEEEIAQPDVTVAQQEAQLELFTALSEEITEKGDISQEFVKEQLDVNLQREIAEFEETEGKRISLQEQAKIELKNVNATIQAIQETAEFAETGQVLFEGKEELLKSLREDKKILQEKIKELQPKKIVKREGVALKEKVKSVERGVRIGKVQTKAEIKSSQTSLVKLLQESDLEAKDKAKFISAIKNVQTQQQLEKILPQITERIQSLEVAEQKRDLIGEFKKSTQKSRVKKLRPEFQKPVQNIIEGLDVTKLSEKKVLTDLTSLARALTSEEGNQIPKARIEQLQRLEKIPLVDMTVDEIQTIVNSVQHLLKLNELKNTIIVKGKLRTANEVVEEVTTNMLLQSERLDGSIDGLDSFQAEQERPLWAKIFGADSYNAELKTEILEDKEQGMAWQVIFKGIDQGETDRLKFMQNAEDFLFDKLKGLDMSKWSKNFQVKEKNIIKVKIPISEGRTLNMSKGERIAFVLHSRNQNNFRHLIEGGISFAKTPSKIIKLTESDIAKVVNSATVGELRVADAIDEYLNTIQKREINKVSVDLNGHEIATEPDYFPIRTNFLDRFRDDLLKAGKFGQISLEGLGIFKERQAATNALILDDAFIATYKSIKQTGSYVGYAKPLRSAKALLKDNDFQIAARDINRKNYIDSLDAYLRRVEGESIRLDNVDKLTTDLINKLDVSILGLNPFVMLKQPISYLGASTEMDFKHLKGNFKFKATESEVNEIIKHSPQLRDRFRGNITRELGEIAEVGRPKKFWTGEEVVSQKYMKGIAFFDRSAIVSLWRSSKAEIRDKFPDLKGGEFFAKVTERTEELVRKTQPTFNVKDRSTIGMSQNVWIRLLTKYSSQRNKNWMIMRRAMMKYNQSHKTPRDKAKVAQAFFIINVVSPMLLMLLDETRDKFFDREEKRNIFQRIISRWITLAIGNIYFLGTGVNSLVSKIERGTWAGYDINDPLSSTMDDIIDSVAGAFIGIGQAISGEKYKSGRREGEEKWKSTLSKSFTGTLDTAGKLRGIPVKGVRRILEGLYKLPERIFGKSTKF